MAVCTFFLIDAPDRRGVSATLQERNSSGSQHTETPATRYPWTSYRRVGRGVE